MPEPEYPVKKSMPETWLLYAFRYGKPRLNAGGLKVPLLLDTAVIWHINLAL